MTDALAEMIQICADFHHMMTNYLHLREGPAYLMYLKHLKINICPIRSTSGLCVELQLATSRSSIWISRAKHVQLCKSTLGVFKLPHIWTSRPRARTKPGLALVSVKEEAVHRGLRGQRRRLRFAEQRQIFKGWQRDQ